MTQGLGSFSPWGFGFIAMGCDSAVYLGGNFWL